MIPNNRHLENIAIAWVQGQLGQAFLNSTYATVVSVSLMLLFAVPAAFGFARLALPMPAVLGLAILMALMIPSEFIMVPLFVMFRLLGLLSTREDAARIDGAQSLHALRYFVVPLAAPAIAAVTVFESVLVWNDYFGPLILIQKPELFTIQLAVGNFSNFYATEQVVRFAGLAIAILPPLAVFAFFQRTFTEGLTVGASPY